MIIDKNKYLGILCKRKHDYESTGKSLRYKSTGNCLKCLIINNKKDYGDKYLYRNLSIEKRERYRQSQKRSKNKRKKKIAISHHLYYMQHAEYLKAYSKKYGKQDNVKIREKKKRDNLNDSYIKERLRAKGLRTKDVNSEMIEIQREIIITKRLLRDIKNYESNSKHA